MIDREKLAEALEVYPEMHGFPRYEFVECAVVEAAARAYLDGETVWWCEVHRAGHRVPPGSPKPEICAKADVAARRTGRNPFDRIICRMVEAVLSVKATEEDE